MKNFFLLVFAGLLLTACANVPIYNVDKHPMPPAARTMTLDQIDKAIVTAASRRGWKTQTTAPGRIRAEYRRPEYSATIDIVFDQASYSIDYVNSENLRERDGTIHSHYVNWVRLLEKDIRKNVQLAATRPAPVT